MKYDELYKAFSEMSPTEAQKQEILKSILTIETTTPIEKQQNKNTPSFLSHCFPRSFATAALLVFLIITTALAAEYFLETGWLHFFGPRSVKQIEALEQSVQVVDKMLYHENGTLHIKQVIGDHKTTLVLMEFTAPENTILDADQYRFEDSSIDVEGYSGYYMYGIEVMKTREKDNQIEMILNINTEESLSGKEMSLSFRNIEAAGNLPNINVPKDSAAWKNAIYRPVISGQWKTSFPLTFQDTSQVYATDQTLNIYGYDATVQTVAISPITISIDMESAELKKIYEASREDTINGDFPLTVFFSDGTSSKTLPPLAKNIEVYGINQPYELSYHADPASGKMQLYYDFHASIFDKEIVALEINGVPVAIKP